jgi:uncharacterized membrane protein
MFPALTPEAVDSPAPVKTRVASVDALRGLVMIIMALDHVRDFFHAAAFQFQPEDLTRTTVAIFFTRWITHLCAPVFMFTAGIGAFFWLSRRRTISELSRFLWKRGLWLIVLELTVLRFAMNFGLFSGVLLLSILWALGWSMIALGFLARLPIRTLAIVSVAVIALHNLADPIQASRFGAAAGLWNILHQIGVFHVGPITALSAYPLVPWFAVMAAGFCFGPILSLNPASRRRSMLRLGLGTIAAFLVIRAINVYGDPQPWSQQGQPVMTALSFLRCTKYPPSLDFLLMTLGPALVLLAMLDRVRLSKTNPLMVFGRVPLFYFLGHFYLAHLLAIPLAFVRYGRAGFLFNPQFPSGNVANPYPPDYGYSLGVVYMIWIGVVAAMYPLCLWFARLKERRSDWWLSYL